MSLVAYENSDSGGENSENEDRENGKVVIPKKGLFRSLPQPNVVEEVNEEEVEDEFLKKKEVSTIQPQKQKVKITIPSLSEFADDDDSDEEPSKKKQKLLSKSSGLFALLPAPKTQPITTKHFVPNSVKRNMAPKSVAPKTSKAKMVKKPEEPQIDKPVVTEELESEDEDLKDIPDTFDEETWHKVCGRPKKTVKPVIKEKDVADDVIEIAPEPVQPYQGLDNQAFKELLGGNSKRKPQNVNILEINEDEIVDQDKHIWMAKSLTDPEMSAKYVVKDPVNDTCRRKHHITYLAQQAKANEQELQNQWASNRFTRQKTQAKYGF